MQVTALSLQLDGLRQRVEEKRNVEENLATALQLADRYKGHLLKEQGHLYTCHLNFYKVVFAPSRKISSVLSRGKKCSRRLETSLPIYSKGSPGSQRGSTT